MSRRLWISAGLLLAASALQGATVTPEPQLGYEYTFGSADYHSHSVSAGVVLKFKRQISFSSFYNFMEDQDYSSIHSGIFRLKGPVSKDWDLLGGFAVSGGNLKDSDTSSSSVSFDFGGTRYLNKGWEWFNGYRYLNGTLVTGVDRQVTRTVRQRGQTTTQIVTVQDKDVSNYVAHTLTTKLGYENQEFLKGLFSAFRLGLTFNSDDAVILTEGVETFIPLPKKFYLGFNFTMNQNSKFADLNYFGISLDKSF